MRPPRSLIPAAVPARSPTTSQTRTKAPQRLGERFGRHGQRHLLSVICAPTEILEQPEVLAEFPSEASGGVQVLVLDDEGQIGETAQAFEEELIDRLALRCARRPRSRIRGDMRRYAAICRTSAQKCPKSEVAVDSLPGIGGTAGETVERPRDTSDRRENRVEIGLCGVGVFTHSPGRVVSDAQLHV